MKKDTHGHEHTHKTLALPVRELLFAHRIQNMSCITDHFTQDVGNASLQPLINVIASAGNRTSQRVKDDVQSQPCARCALTMAFEANPLHRETIDVGRAHLCVPLAKWTMWVSNLCKRTGEALVK